MLGAAEANKIQADTDHEKTGGMYLRINQFGDQCTVDASVAKYAVPSARGGLAIIL